MNTVARTLESFANVAIVVAAVTVAGTWGHYYWNQDASSGPPYYELGERVGNVPELSLEDAELTLLVYVNSECPACTASMPFHGRLLEQHRASDSIVRVVFASREDLMILRSYAAEHELDPPALASIPAGSPFKNIATPHILLVKRDGEVVGTWLGKLAAPYEEIVIEAALRTAMPAATRADTELQH